MVTVTQQKCACTDCVCIVDMKSAVTKGGRNYCGEACAEGHPKGTGCEHAGCVCHG
jgi:hypothetical protein